MADTNREIELIEESGLFDRRWYLAEYPDVGATGLDPLDHYLRYGGRLGRSPGPRFDAKRYLETYPDIGSAGVNPLLHYVLYGRQEGRTAVPCFSAGGSVDPVIPGIDTPDMEPATDVDTLKSENRRLRALAVEQKTEIEMNLVQLRGLQEELENWFRQYVDLKERLESSNISDGMK